MSLEEYYPVSCPFCAISVAYPPSSNSPIPLSPDPEKVFPQCHLILSTPHVLAFLDILPIAPGHILLTTRDHYRKLSDLYAASTHSQEESKRESAQESSRALGEYLPLVSAALVRATGIEDWNVVQNNGERAAQVVPHVHFHLIPRYQEGRREGKGNVDVGMLKSWRMFGRGAREDLDDEEGVEMARCLREALRVELGEEGSEGGGGEGGSKL
ncbi:hypothetical protein LTR37_011239 [Vermiconidia calcicola]|uniref:Uncharacterized protein n=1 Tax=Vermiconidia calcicola TaxID=1690605 RepID=A0ACC3N3E4_9PEZI|nr:hypothetical protein LTR37_011239 [Vermiconidia calcicola]